MEVGEPQQLIAQSFVIPELDVLQNGIDQYFGVGVAVIMRPARGLRS